MSVDSLAGLDDQQRTVVKCLEGPVLVLAGAGTGKTRAITHRIAHGVTTGVFDARRTLAVTFTTRAAGELRARLGGLGVDGVQARTFHSAALRQLRYFWPRLTHVPFPSVISSKAAAVARVLSRSGQPTEKSFVRDVVSDIEWARINFFDEHTVSQAATDHEFSLDTSALSQVLAGYAEEKSIQGVMDFEDVMIGLIGALEADHSIAREVHNVYRWFTVDEYQDVNPVQHHLLNLWRGDREDLCVVGDPSQTIYSFAGARREFLTEFTNEHPGATTVRLVQCYRSTPEIVDLANSVVSTDRSSVEPIRMTTHNASGPKPTIVAYEDDVAEAHGIADRVKKLVDSGSSPRDIAVLYRVNSQQVAIESALTDVGVPVSIRGSERYFERAEVREAITRLRAAAHLVGQRADFGVDKSDTYTSRASLADQVADVLSAMHWSSEPPFTTGAVRDRWESLAALVNLASDQAEGDLASFVDLLNARASEQHAPESDGVTLASLHATKGLEWESVFIAGCSDGLIPFRLADEDGDVDEERRLLYVGITRAKRFLCLSWSRARHPGGRTARELSRFLAVADLAGGIKKGGSVTSNQGRDAKSRRQGRAPARCRACQKSLVTANERAVGRCRNCPASYDEALLATLKDWRRGEAETEGVPAYVIFTDATLISIAEVRPKDLSEFSAISGVGPNKLAKYGERILQLVGDDLRD